MPILVFFLSLLLQVTSDHTLAGAVRGRVISLDTGDPVAGASITLRTLDKSRAYKATTDADGRFEFVDLDAGIYRLTALRPGFVSRTFGEWEGELPVQGSILEIKRGLALDGLTIKLSPQAELGGRVVDELGKAVEGAIVQAFQFRDVSAKRQLLAVASAQTDSEGEYWLGHLRSGRYYVGARPAIDESLDKTNKASGLIFYGATLFGGSATPFDLKAGSAVTNVDLQFTKRPVVTVSGKVIGAGGTDPDATIRIALVPDDVTSLTSTGTSVDVEAGQEFVISGVAPGTYSLIADATASQPQLAAWVPLEVDREDVRNVELQLRPAIGISGRVEVSPDYGGVWKKIHVELKPADNLFENAAEADLNEDGSFVLHGLLPIRYGISIFHILTGNIHANWTDQSDVLRNGIDLRNGPYEAPLQIALGGIPKGQLQGFVRNRAGKGVPGATVIIVSASGVNTSIVSTGVNGVFQIQGLRPGDYAVYGFEEIASYEYGDPDFRRRFENWTEKVTIRETGMTTTNVKLIPAEAFDQ